jgi:hypothetical protein
LREKKKTTNNATMSRAARATITIKLSLKDKVLARNRVSLNISAANIGKNYDSYDKKSEKDV